MESESESKQLRETIQRLENHLADQIKMVEEVLKMIYLIKGQGF